MMFKAISCLGLVLTIAGCGSMAPATIEAECRILKPAPYAVQADRIEGQIWLDRTIESGVRVCGHRRPPKTL